VCACDYECSYKIMMTGADNKNMPNKHLDKGLHYVHYSNICYMQYQIMSTINRKKKNYTTPLPREQELIVNRKQHE